TSPILARANPRFSGHFSILVILSLLFHFSRAPKVYFSLCPSCPLWPNPVGRRKGSHKDHEEHKEKRTNETAEVAEKRGDEREIRYRFNPHLRVDPSPESNVFLLFPRRPLRFRPSVFPTFRQRFLVF